MIETNNSFKKFLIIWLGELISSIGSGLTAFAFTIYVFEKTNSATCVSIITLCAFLPSLLLSPLGGVLADRFDRRLMMVVGDFLSAMGLIYILITMSIGSIELWQIYFGVTISSIFTSLMEPAYKATVTDLLIEDEFAKASGLVQVASSAKYLFSPLIAGLLLGITNIKVVLFIDICTFFITVVAVLLVKRNMENKKIDKSKINLFIELKEGWKAIVSTKGVLILVLQMSAVTLFMGVLQTLFTPMILPLTNSKTLGIIQSVSASGMLVTSLVIGIFGKNINPRTILILGLGLSGVFFSFVGVSTSIGVIAIFGFLFFSTLPLVNTGADVLIRKNIPNEVQGRAWSLIGLISQLGYVVAYGFSGLLADYVFNPMLIKGGSLSSSVGKIIGIGEGRGIGLLCIICGIFIVAMSLTVAKSNSVQYLDKYFVQEG